MTKGGGSSTESPPFLFQGTLRLPTTSDAKQAWKTRPENPGGQEKEFRIGLLGGLLALGRLPGPALRHDPELEQRVADDHGKQGVDHGCDRACDAGVHAPSLAQTGHVARQHKVHYHDDHGEDHILPSGVLEAGVGLEDPLHLHEEVHHLRKHLGKQEGEESAQAVALGVIVEDQEVERLREPQAGDENGGADPRHHETGNGGDVRQHIEQDEFPDIGMILDPLANRSGLLIAGSGFGRLRSIVVQSWFSSFAVCLFADWLRKKPAITPPNPRKVWPFAIFTMASTIAESTMPWVILLMARGGIFRMNRVFRSGEPVFWRIFASRLVSVFGDGTRHEALGIHPRHDRIVDAERRRLAGGKHLMAEQHCHFGVGHVLDLSGQIVAKRRIGGAIGGRAIAGHGVRNRKRQMLRIVADQQRPFAAFRLPCIGGNIEMTERVAVEIDVHTLCFHARPTQFWRSPSARGRDGARRPAARAHTTGPRWSRRHRNHW